jgi:hypothetical protein
VLEERGYFLFAIAILLFVLPAMVTAFAWRKHTQSNTGEPIAITIDLSKINKCLPPITLAGRGFYLTCIIIAVSCIGGLLTLYETNKEDYNYSEYIFSNPDRPFSIGELKDRLGEGRSRMRLRLSPGVKEFHVSGTLTGQCRKDFYERICNQYVDQIVCSQEPGNEMTIKLPGESF